MKSYLEIIGKEKDTISEDFELSHISEYGEKVVRDSVNVYRALKALTTPAGEAKLLGSVELVPCSLSASWSETSASSKALRCRRLKSAIG